MAFFVHIGVLLGFLINFSRNTPGQKAKRIILSIFNMECPTSSASILLVSGGEEPSSRDTNWESNDENELGEDSSVNSDDPEEVKGLKNQVAVEKEELRNMKVAKDKQIRDLVDLEDEYDDKVEAKAEAKAKGKAEDEDYNSEDSSELSEMGKDIE